MEQPLFQIGEVSKMIGIAPETIRHYERKNVLTPVKQKENSYRVFSMADVCTINQVRSFLRYGFSIDEAQELLNTDQVEQTQYALMNRAAVLEKAIEEQLRVVNAIHQRLLDIQTVTANLGKFREIQMDRIYLIPAFCETGEPVRQKTPDTLRWFNNQPAACPFALFRQEALLEGHARAHTMGMCILERDREKGNLTIPEESRILELGRCLYTSVRMGGGTSEKESLAPVAQYLKDNGAAAGGDVLGRTVAVQREEGEKVYYMELLIPLRNEICP